MIKTLSLTTLFCLSIALLAFAALLFGICVILIRRGTGIRT